MNNLQVIDKEVFDNLSSETPEKRQKSIEFLSSIHNISLYEKIITYLESEDPILKNASMELLIKWGVKVVPLLLERTKNPDSNQRLFSANILGEIGDKSSINNLLELLTDEESNVRFAAAEAIGKIGSKEATMPLLHYLYSKIEDPWEVFPLILALGQIGDEKAVPALLELTDNEILRQPVLQAIGNIADEHAIPFLIHTLKSNDQFTINMAIIAIRNLLKKLEKYQLGEKNLVLEISNQFSNLNSNEIDKIIDNLKISLKEKSFSIKLSSIFILGIINNEKSIDILLENFEEELMPEIEYSLFNLAKNNSEKFISSLDNDNVVCKDIILKILGDLKIISSKDKVIEFIFSPNIEIKIEAINTLGKLQINDTIDILIQQLFNNENSLDVKNALVKSLQRFHTNKILPKLLKYIEEDQNNELDAFKVIKELEPIVNINKIKHFYKSNFYDVRKCMAVLLKKYDDNEAGDILISLLSDSNPLVREEAVRSLEGRGEKGTIALTKLINDEEAWVRYCVAKALGKQKNIDIIKDSLKTLLLDSVPFVQIAAIESIGNLKINIYSRELLDLVLSDDSDLSQAAIIALSQIELDSDEEMEFQILVDKQIENKNWVIRQAIAKVLGNIKKYSSLEQLLRMLASENESLVDKEILFSLGKLPFYDNTIPLLLELTEISELRDYSILVLTELGSNAIPYLQKVLETEDYEIKINIISILAKVDNDKSMQLLLNLASNDYSSNVRKQAILALNNFNNNQRAMWAIMWAANHDTDNLVRQTAKSLLFTKESD